MVRVIRSFHIGNIIGQANVWFNYVASKANVADLPSRDALHEMADILRAHEPGFDLGAAQRMFVWPDLPSGPDVDAVWAATAAQMAPAGACAAASALDGWWETIPSAARSEWCLGR